MVKDLWLRQLDRIPAEDPCEPLNCGEASVCGACSRRMIIEAVRDRIECGPEMPEFDAIEDVNDLVHRWGLHPPNREPLATYEPWMADIRDLPDLEDAIAKVEEERRERPVTDPSVGINI